MITKTSNKQISEKEVKTKEVFMFPSNPPVIIEAQTREEAEDKFKKLTNKK